MSTVPNPDATRAIGERGAWLMREEALRAQEKATAPPQRVTPLLLAVLLAVVGCLLVFGGLWVGVAPWVAVVALGATLVFAAFLVDTPRRGRVK